MKIIHSVKTLGTGDKFYTMIYCTILSCLYAKESGLIIKLYTDSYAYEFLKHAPYDEIEVCLDDMEAVPSTYASCKYEALKREPLGSIHIDCDVFLKNPNFIYELDFEGKDLIVQSVETYGAPFVSDKGIIGGSWCYALNLVKHIYSPLWAKKACDKMYNCGVVGFNNQALKDLFISQYELGLRIIKSNKDKIKPRTLSDLIIEQQHLYDICLNYGFSVKTVLDAEHLQEEAVIKDYQHLIGGSKHGFIDKIKKLIYKKDYKLYKTVTDLINEHKNKKQNGTT